MFCLAFVCLVAMVVIGYGYERCCFLEELR